MNKKCTEWYPKILCEELSEKAHAEAVRQGKSSNLTSVRDCVWLGFKFKEAVYKKWNDVDQVIIKLFKPDK